MRTNTIILSAIRDTGNIYSTPCIIEYVLTQFTPLKRNLRGGAKIPTGGQSPRALISI
jgi:hypothetical protein